MKKWLNNKNELIALKNLFDIFVSFWQLTRKVMLRKKCRVLFYYPQHFNRTAQGTNPFFDRLLETCDKHGVSFHLIEEPDRDIDKPRNAKAIKGDAFFVLVMVVRKVMNMFCHGDFWQDERKVAFVINILTLGRLKYEKYITISGSMLHLFAAMNDKGDVYDMQHGILFKQKETFFDENEHLWPHYYGHNLHWLFWGKGYEQCFCRGDEDIMRGRAHVVGYPLSVVSNINVTVCHDKIILFSLQFTHDYTAPLLELQKALFEQVLEQLKGMGVRVLLKHHPRYNNSISIDDWFGKYDFVELTSLSMQELMSKVMLQVTVNSTTSFEYAEVGIPSFFIDPQGQIPQGTLFYSEYRYPLYQSMSICQVVERLQSNVNSKQDASIVQSWYCEFYDDYNEQAFLGILES